jgi:hypothetical protein
MSKIGSLTFCGKELQMLDEVKYFGVTLYSKLNWNQHLQTISRKLQTTFAVVRRICGKYGEPSGARPHPAVGAKGEGKIKETTAEGIGLEVNPRTYPFN